MSEEFFKLIPEEKEAIDTFAFSQILLEKGGDVERRFALIALDNSLEIALRAYLLKRGVKKEVMEGVRKIDDLILRCEKAGLKVEEERKLSFYAMHQKRNQIYHGKTVMLPTRRDLEAWSKLVGSLIWEVTGINPFEYFKSRA